ncbi:hypothetical protein HY634_02440 [Candidatus Uhrbacteria bacterium]|nr:hypothetical protein [Candidatus Uhrbacteria bacterium]
MRILFVLSTIAVIATPMRAEADPPCPRGYELIPSSGPWAVCAPITDPQRCEPILVQQACDNGMGFFIGSHLAACQRRVGVLNERCEANKAAAKARAKFEAVCLLSTPSDDPVCTAAAIEANRTWQHAREVRETTERRLHQPVGSGGRGVHVCI